MTKSAQPGSGLEQYKRAGAGAALESASPHRLIQMLLEGAVEKLKAAREFMQRGELASKGSHISWAISIIEGLRLSLDKQAGGEISQNLDDLYDYMGRRLMQANQENSVEMVDEVLALLGEIKSAWDAVGPVLQEQQTRLEDH